MQTDLDPKERAWIALADCCLGIDVENRILLATLACVEAGYDAREVSRVWRYDLMPVVQPCLPVLAGEWLGWDESWLVQSVAAEHERRPEKPGLFNYCAYRLKAGEAHEIGERIAREVARHQFSKTAAGRNH